MPHTLPTALRGIRSHVSHMLRCTCGGETFPLLLMDMYYQDGRWWLVGYEAGDLGLPLILEVTDDLRWVMDEVNNPGEG